MIMTKTKIKEKIGDHDNHDKEEDKDKRRIWPVEDCPDVIIIIMTKTMTKTDAKTKTKTDAKTKTKTQTKDNMASGELYRGVHDYHKPHEACQKSPPIHTLTCFYVCVFVKTCVFCFNNSYWMLVRNKY